MSNVKATRRVVLLAEVKDLYVFPHMGDGGLALGAAVIAAVGAGEPMQGFSTIWISGRATIRGRLKTPQSGWDWSRLRRQPRLARAERLPTDGS